MGKKNHPSWGKDRQKGTETRPFDGSALTRKGNARTGKGTSDGTTSSVQSRREAAISSRA
jgi:hypothetical protein